MGFVQHFLFAVGLGFSTSFACAATCLPVYFPFAVSGGRGYRQVVFLLIGRFGAYILVGVLAGALGSAVSVGLVKTASSASIVVLAMLLFARSAGLFRRDIRFCSLLFRLHERIHSPLLVGFFMGFTLCYPFLLAVAQAASLRSAMGGAVVFGGFYVGTSGFLIPLFLVPLLKEPRLNEWLFKLASVLAAVLALFYLSRALQELIPERRAEIAVTTEEVGALFPDGGRIERLTQGPLPYYAVYGETSSGGQPSGYAILSSDFSGDVRGYGGTIPVLLALDPSGHIIDLRVLENSETPSYVSYLFSDEYLSRFKGKSYRDGFDIGRDVDAVSGATVSLTALAETIRRSVRTFCARVLALPVPDSAPAKRHLLDAQNMAVILLFALGAAALLSRSRFRIPVLLASTLVLGLYFNFSLSIADLVKILFGLSANSPEYPYRFVLAILALAATVLFGRFYCGSICPYGALQELLYRISPLKRTVSPALDRRLRWVKYGVLLGIPFLFASSRNFGVFNFEPFQLSFHVMTSLNFLTGLLKTNAVLLCYLLFLLAAAMVLERFFCSYLCPLGALFALLSSIRLLPRRLFMIKGRSCAGCVKGNSDSESECYLCGGVGTASSQERS